MDVTNLNRLIAEGDVARHPNGLTVKVRDSWVIPGEKRLSYTTLIRLVECCREYHWEKDILPLMKETRLDSITKSITAEFLTPIPVRSVISIVYLLTDIRSKGYALEFQVMDATDRSLRARVSMVSVFYDPDTGTPIVPPEAVSDFLSSRTSKA